MAPGKNSYRMATPLYDARERRLRVQRKYPFLWGVTVGVVVCWTLIIGFVYLVVG